MKEFKLVIGGQERVVRCGSREAADLYERFGKPLALLIREDVGGYNEKGELAAAFNRKIQAAFLVACLRRGGWRTVTEDQAFDLIDSEIAAGGNVYALLSPCIQAAFYSGAVTGVSQELELKSEAADQGKAPETPTPMRPADDL